MQRNRPIGVTIVAILMIVNGAFVVGGGIFAIYIVPKAITPELTSNLTNITIGNQTNIQLGDMMTGVITTVVIVVSSISIALGIAAFVLAWGVLNGKGWSWTITVILAIISLIFSVLSLGGASFTSVVTLIINGIILYYMYRPPVKTYFGGVKIPK